MRVDSELFEPGTEVAYRASDSVEMRSRRAVVERTEPAGKSSIRVVLRLDDGKVRKVARNRIKGLWSEAAAIDAELNFKIRLLNQTGDEIEQRAASGLIEVLVGHEIVDLMGDHEGLIRNASELESLLEVSLGRLLEGVLNKEIEDQGLWISPLGMIRIAQRYSHKHPTKVLDFVMEDEAKCARELAETQGTNMAQPRWDFYREYYRPVFELRREWCGHAAVHEYERSAAIEAEARRLFDLAERMIREMQSVSPESAKRYRQELIGEQISPYTIRERPERPLRPEDIPTRIEYRRGWWR